VRRSRSSRNPPIVLRRRAISASIGGFRLSLLARYAVAVPIAAAFIFPFYWMLVISLNRLDAIFEVPPRLIPQWQFQNYAEAWRFANWLGLLGNTLITTTGRVVLVLLTSILAGYAFASMRFAGKAIVFGIVLAVYMVPAEITLVPNYITLSRLGWIDSYQAQFVPLAASVFGIFLMRQYFLTLPKDLWEAAQLDGCDHLRFLALIAAPLARPALVTIGLLQFIEGWNAFLWPLIVTSTDRVRPLQVGLAAFSFTDSTRPELLAAGAFMTTVPILVLFLIAQRQLVGGIASTGIRG
jgi:multiple sugar transport system permease protein